MCFICTCLHKHTSSFTTSATCIYSSLPKPPSWPAPLVVAVSIMLSLPCADCCCTSQVTHNGLCHTDYHLKVSRGRREREGGREVGRQGSK